MRKFHFVRVCLLLAAVFALVHAAAAGTVHNYYVAADELTGTTLRSAWTA
jgi:hypothetical protein